VLLTQARQKTLYYSRLFQDHKDMPIWYEESYLKLNHPFQILHGTRPPSWLSKFKGTHPAEICRLIQDCRQGTYILEPYNTERIDHLLESRVYRFAGFLLRYLYFIIPPILSRVKRMPVVWKRVLLPNFLRKLLKILNASLVQWVTQSCRSRVS
jgi:hypothetical protein